jgi:hypothetical protein
VQTHFQAYGTALQANDLEQADVALQAALAASVARDGDGGWTRRSSPRAGPFASSTSAESPPGSIKAWLD